jgi:hypothetical protein
MSWGLFWAVGTTVAAVAAGRPHGGGEVPVEAVRASLQEVATELASKYNMSIALSFYSEASHLGFSSTVPGDVAVAAGFTDSGLGMGTPTRAAVPDDLYVCASSRPAQ